VTPSALKRCAVAALALCVFGCKTDRSDAASRAQAEAKARNDSIQKMAAQTAQTYRSMTNSDLLGKLVEQSAKQKEPFNSLAFRELRGRTDVPADAIVSIVDQLKDGRALLPLLLLRRLHPREYSSLPEPTRAVVLTDALQQSRTFNSWGLPHLYLEEASKAMLESGESAYPALTKMLEEKRPAPIWGGGQEGREADLYKYRLCDYALFFLERMQGHTSFTMPTRTEDRDSLINVLSK
jgi:hypothetical protein